ncbi:hypothetical protein FOA52_007718 [Chlamydomonas sp. UWO 241]|nr:hypothetical protein FOA52_007718 [Chlamydomonas sp. UWO 241]
MNPNTAAALMLLVFGVALMAPGIVAQGMSNTYQNQFQCWPGVSLSGVPIATPFIAKNPDECARKCTEAVGCTMFTLTRSMWCNMKSLPFDSLYGTTKREAGTMTSCIFKVRGGTLPSPANAMCYQGQDIAGNTIANTLSVTDSLACATLCQSVPGCAFTVFRATGFDGVSAPVCSLKNAAFAGGEDPAITRRDPLVTGLCLRAYPAPAIIDPLLEVAGPTPFKIFASGTTSCLRSPSPSYTAGSYPYFSSDCSGGEALWTYDAATQILHHYLSGLCLSSLNADSGAIVTLSSDCGPGSRIVSRGSGALQLLAGPRWLMPIDTNAGEGTLMVAVTNGAQPYMFTPSPGEAFECYYGVDIPGTPVNSTYWVADANACAKLCITQPGCTFFSYTLDRWCHMRADAFTNGAVVPNAMFSSTNTQASCLGLKDSSTTTSPANYLCYPHQRISGTVIGASSTAFSPAECQKRCTDNSACTWAQYEYNNVCTIGYDAFLGNLGRANNRHDESVMQLCMRAQGAPDTTQSGYVCFDNVDINGYQVYFYDDVPSRDECTRRCEGKAELCTLAIYDYSSRKCVLRNDAFGWGGNGVQALGQSVCLRSASGGPLNSPVDYLCYGFQSVAGTHLTTYAGVANTTVCAGYCTANPECTFAVYNASDAARCHLKKQPFWGAEGSTLNRRDNAAGVCFQAPGAPLVISGFGVQNPNATANEMTTAGANATANAQEATEADKEMPDDEEATENEDSVAEEDNDEVDWSGVGFGSAWNGAP